MPDDPNNTAKLNEDLPPPPGETLDEAADKATTAEAAAKETAEKEAAQKAVFRRHHRAAILGSMTR